MNRRSKPSASWSAVKAKLGGFDRAGLLALVHDLYAASKDNQTFLHARLGLGDDVLKPYKEVIDRELWPDWLGNENPSVTKAKKAISDYKKAIGRPEGLAELMVFYCERASGFSADIGLQDEPYFDALVRMFERALKAIAALPKGQRPLVWARLEAVCRVSHDFGYGVGDEMDYLLAKYKTNVEIEQ